MAMAYNSSITILPRFFDKYRALAVGIALSGSGVGSFVFPPIIKALEYTYGWRGAILMMGGLYAQGILFGSLYAPTEKTPQRRRVNELPEDGNGRLLEKAIGNDIVPEDDVKQKKMYMSDLLIISSHSLYSITVDMNVNDGTKTLDVPTNSQTNLPHIKIQNNLIIESIFLLRNINFLCMCVSFCVSYSATNIIYTHYGGFILSKGFSNTDVVLLYMAMGITKTLTRVMTGFLSKITKFNSSLVFSACYISIGTITILIPISQKLALFYAYSVAFCLFISPPDILSVQIIVDSLPFDKMPTGYGICNLFCFPGTVAAPPIAGWFYLVYAHIYVI